MQTGNMKDRRKYLGNIKRAVVKIGSSSLTSLRGGLDLENMARLIKGIKDMRDGGLEVILVSSGAMAAGLEYLDIKKDPAETSDISLLQAAASVGQVELMKAYRDLFLDRGIKVGQILLTHEDTTRREQYLNIKSTINNLLKLGVVPVINENDTVATDEIKFGDNDELGAMAAILSEADLMIILSDIDGMYSRDPRIDSKAQMLSFVEKIDDDIEESAGGRGSAYGIGGMLSKIKAARICTFSGIGMAIANSRRENVLPDILEGKDIGTFFKPRQGPKVKSIKKWIAFGVRTRGAIIIDDGAREAVIKRGTSILPVGITGVKGKFVRGDTLKVMSADDVMIAKGITSLSSEDIKKIMGKNEKTILPRYGRDMCGEVIHRDCLVVFENDR
jgi:glutamate 5-kinase